MNSPKKIGVVYSILLFLIPGIIFWVHLNHTIPLLTMVFGLSAYAAWLISGTFLLFMPLFILTLLLMKSDGYSLDRKTVLERLRIKRITKNDWLWIITGFLVAVVLIGLIVSFLVIMPLGIDIADLKNISPIEPERLAGRERFFLLLLPLFFFFNYVGEEILWRGYILPRQEVALGNYAWIFNGVLHGVFHLSFGLLVNIVALPLLLLVPLVTYKTRNTSTAIVIHFIMGAPMQIMVVFGIIS
ncbi:MAG: CPBP family intramembrane metalloprotease [Marinilabiliales bacterium]|nr:MAG: CPBP family intramembrane metalloprotease [Marinilabiliales bacterium]